MEPNVSAGGIPPKKILIVEDEIMTARALWMALIAEGHNVERAESGERAMELFEAGDHELIITDFKLPKMDGLELAEAIKKRKASRPIILITAYAEPVSRMGTVSNVDLLLGKPFSLAALHEGIRKLFPVQPAPAQA